MDSFAASATDAAATSPMQYRTLPLLRSLALITVLAATPPIAAQFDLVTPENAVLVDFDLAGSPNCSYDVPWTDNGTLPNCYSDRPTFNYSNGCAMDGGLHIAGEAGEMALGGRSSTSMSAFKWGVRFRNSTGITLSGLRVRVRAEQWNNATSNVQNVVQFGYRTSSTAITDVGSGAYTPVPALNLTNFTPPTGCSGAGAAINGNLPEYFAQLEACITVTLAPGDEIMLRWSDVNESCNDHMLLTDDLEVTGLVLPTLTPSGTSQICAGEQVTLTVENGTDVEWSTGETGPTLTVDGPGIYTATSAGGCGGPIVLTHTVEEIEAPTVTIDPATATLCPGATLELTATGTGDLLWSTSEATASITVDAPGPYSVEASNACGTAEASIVVGEDSAPTAVITPAGGTVLCAQGTLELTASGGDSYLWSTGGTDATETVNGADTWTVTVTNACGTDEASITTTLMPAPEVEITASDLVLCGNDEVVLTATGDGPFAWSTGDTGPEIHVGLPGVYTATVTNACATITASITLIDGAVDAVFSAVPMQGRAPLTVDFTSTSGNGLTHGWDLGNGETAEGVTPTTTYTAPGSYTVILTVIDPVTGCSATAEVVVIVEPGDSWVRVPNIITPNGDGTNDGFSVEHEALLDLECSITNRWGQEVGRLTHPNDVWRGSEDGDAVPEGTYFYVLTAHGWDGKTFALQGHLTVLR